MKSPQVPPFLKLSVVPAAFVMALHLAGCGSGPGSSGTSMSAGSSVSTSATQTGTLTMRIVKGDPTETPGTPPSCPSTVKRTKDTISSGATQITVQVNNPSTGAPLIAPQVFSLTGTATTVQVTGVPVGPAQVVVDVQSVQGTDVNVLDLAKTNVTVAPGLNPVTLDATPVTAFADNFTCGGSDTSFTADPYWLNHCNCNAFVVQKTCCVGPCHCGFPFFRKSVHGQAICQGVTPGGFFLFEGTANVLAGDPKAANFCATNHVFFCSRRFAVAPNTEYEVSYFTASPNTSTCCNSAEIQLQMNGSDVGCPVTSHSFASCSWQHHTFTFCSGSNNTERLSLLNLQVNGDGIGNDFGVANIGVNIVLDPPQSNTSLPVFVP